MWNAPHYVSCIELLSSVTVKAPVDVVEKWPLTAVIAKPGVDGLIYDLPSTRGLHQASISFPQLAHTLH